MNVLAIERSCDETSIAIINGSFRSSSKTKLFPVRVLANVVSSQIKVHEKWGGVVPNLAAREHLKNITPVLNQALSQANLRLSEVDLFAVTQGPGLIPALLIGVNVAKTLAYFFQKPLIGIHHVEGHIYANFIPHIRNSKRSVFPILALVVSGGHTQLIFMKNHLQYQIVGQTLDDAAGEAFDKIAKIMELGYPGGPLIAKQAEIGRAQLTDNSTKKNLAEYMRAITFPRPMLSKQNFDFSFSGLKTAVLYYYHGILKQHPDLKKKKNKDLLGQLRSLIAKEAEEAIVEVLVKKTLRAAKMYHPKTILLAGGVAANRHLQHSLKQTIEQYLPPVTFIQPPLEFCGDNAAMIAVAALYRMIHHKKNASLGQLRNYWRSLEPDANLKLTSLANVL